MIEAFKQFIKVNNLCGHNDKILLAVSGGVDSMVMVDLFNESGYEVAIAHCNFKLRGKESDGDEEFVRKVAVKHNIESYFKSFETQEIADKNKLSIQEAARNLRYDWFNDLCDNHGFSKIAVAHHLDDQKETFFINLFRGSGLKGLKGIPIVRGKIIRPLLFASRKEIESYAYSKNIEFRSDSSNDSGKYLRNQIRHNLLPVVEDLKPGFQERFESSLELLKEDNQVFEELLNEKRKRLFQREGDRQKIEIGSVKDLSAAMFFYLLSVFGFNRSVTNSIFQSIKSNEIGKVFLSSTYRLLVDRNFLIIEKLTEVTDSEIFLINKTDNEITLPVHLNFKIYPKDDTFRIKKEKAVAYFDFEKLTFPLLLRRWEHGDRFTPFGMKGSKLISDYLIDDKVDNFAKEKVWVLISGKEIIWVVGYRASNKFNITIASKEVLEVRLF